MADYNEVAQQRYDTQLALLKKIDSMLAGGGHPAHIEKLASAFALVYSGKPLGFSDSTEKN